MGTLKRKAEDLLEIDPEDEDSLYPEISPDPPEEVKLPGSTSKTRPQLLPDDKFIAVAFETETHIYSATTFQRVGVIEIDTDIYPQVPFGVHVSFGPQLTSDSGYILVSSPRRTVVSDLDRHGKLLNREGGEKLLVGDHQRKEDEAVARLAASQIKAGVNKVVGVHALAHKTILHGDFASFSPDGSFIVCAPGRQTVSPNRKFTLSITFITVWDVKSRQVRYDTCCARQGVN
ncbi:hypothetical protein BDW59DRAFT_160105 [Aspergillus cavernicola]|uniref:Uncharacterized protein n=1 Tax=Aspergillus cavernicola TaxID=176166 RepID=A0ABR4IJ48_9EURO